jgi:cytoskeletal protein CcmA (bactofilin family)
MWKKEDMLAPTRPEVAPTRPEVAATRPELAAARPEPAPSADRSGPSADRSGPSADRSGPSKAGRERATIGRSITIRGDVTGDEDLLIQGRVDGSVNLKQHSVTVGSEGEVKANISGRVVTVEGSVEGNLSAEEQVILRSSARVQGDIAAPRLVLEDGARFRGGVDMGETVEPSGRTEVSPRAAAARMPEPGRTVPGAVELPTHVETGASPDEPKSASTRKGDGISPAAAHVSR